MIVFFTFAIGAFVAWTATKGDQQIFDNTGVLFLALLIAAAHLLGGALLLLQKQESKYIYLAIALIEIYLWWFFTDSSEFVEHGVIADGVPTTAYRSPIPVGNLLWVVATILVWRYFRKGKNNA